MVEFKTGEEKSLMLGILKEIDKICRENDIKYFLFFGTLIGAVRHKGFIPWDDDIDVAILREDLPKFKKAIAGNERYRLLTTDDNGYYYFFGKVVDKKTKLIEPGFRKIDGLGLYVDVFVLDNLGDKDMEHYHAIEKEVSRQMLIGHDFPKFRDFAFPKYIKKCLRYVKCAYLLGLRKVVSKYEEKVGKYSFDDSNFLSVVGTIYHDKCIFPKSCFTDTVELEFEGEKFLAPVGYDEVLRKVYGDYMKLPPEDKRTSGHSYRASWR